MGIERKGKLCAVVVFAVQPVDSHVVSYGLWTSNIQSLFGAFIEIFFFFSLKNDFLLQVTHFIKYTHAWKLLWHVLGSMLSLFMEHHHPYNITGCVNLLIKYLLPWFQTQRSISMYVAIDYLQQLMYQQFVWEVCRREQSDEEGREMSYRVPTQCQLLKETFTDLYPLNMSMLL